MPTLRPAAAELTSVRPADPADVPAVVAIGRDAWRVTFGPLVGAEYVAAGLVRFWAPEVVAAEIAANRVLVAERGSEILGMAAARTEEGQTFLARLYVRPSQHRCGIGGLLLRAVLDAAQGPVALTVLSTNTVARAFYARHGFRPDGVVPDPDGGPDQVRLVRAQRPSRASTMAT